MPFHRPLVLALILPLAAAAPAAAAGLRVEAGLGGDVAFVNADLDASARAFTGVEEATVGGAGAAANVGLWFDSDVGLSVGVQGFADRAELDIEIDDETFDGERNAYGGMLLLAWRRVAGPYHPYAGGGIGVSRVEAAYEQFDNGLLEVDIDDAYTGPTYAVFTGFDVDLGPNAYLGLRLALRLDEGEVEVSGAGSADWTQATTSITGQLGVRF